MYIYVASVKYVHYKLPFDVYAYTFDMCTNKIYLLTYLLTYKCVYTCDLSQLPVT